MRFNTASGMDCMQFAKIFACITTMMMFQYRKRYGLHAISSRRRHHMKLNGFNTASGMDCMQCGRGLHTLREWKDPRVSIPQAVWIACNVANVQAGRRRESFQYRKRYGLHAIAHVTSTVWGTVRFNTASGMDCMQYRPSQPLGQLNPEAGFLNGSLFLANRRNLAGFFCRQNRLKTSANPVISRKLLSTGKI